MRGSSFGLIPMPVSLISMHTDCRLYPSVDVTARSYALNVIRPPSGVYFTALSRRMRIACFIIAISAFIMRSAYGNSSSSAFSFIGRLRVNS